MQRYAILFVETYRKDGVFSMNLSISDELELFAEELQRYMSPHALDQLARKIGFVQRRSKYRAQDLVALCVWLSQNIANTSLTQLCSRLETNTGISMSPEGLNQRFNSQAVQFLQQLLAYLLQRNFVLLVRFQLCIQTIFGVFVYWILHIFKFQINSLLHTKVQGSGQNAGVKSN